MRPVLVASLLLAVPLLLAPGLAASPPGEPIPLLDLRGFVANPAATLTVQPPTGMAFPVSAYLFGDDPRLHFSIPGTASATGPSIPLSFPSATTRRDILFAIFPDRDALSEDHALTVVFTDALGRHAGATYAVRVTDLDGSPAAPRLRITVDYSHDQTGFFLDAAKRAVVQRAADDWADLLADVGYDAVPAGAETTWIWDPTGFTSGHYVTNANAYQGFLLYAYGIHTPALRSGGEGSYAGGLQHVRGVTQDVRRSGGLEVETDGNYNSLGWRVSLSDADWWVSRNLGGEQADLYSIVHHEIGHSLGFNGAYPKVAAAKAGTGELTSAGILAYHKAPLRIDATDHFPGQRDDASRRGAFGNEYNGLTTLGRWLPTTLDVLGLQAVGYTPSDGDLAARQPGASAVVTATFP